jgi:hypothetical protein
VHYYFFLQSLGFSRVHILAATVEIIVTTKYTRRGDNENLE